MTSSTHSIEMLVPTGIPLPSQSATGAPQPLMMKGRMVTLLKNEEPLLKERRKRDIFYAGDAWAPYADFKPPKKSLVCPVCFYSEMETSVDMLVLNPWLAMCSDTDSWNRKDPYRSDQVQRRIPNAKLYTCALLSCEAGCVGGVVPSIIKVASLGLPFCGAFWSITGLASLIVIAPVTACAILPCVEEKCATMAMDRVVRHHNEEIDRINQLMTSCEILGDSQLDLIPIAELIKTTPLSEETRKTMVSELNISQLQRLRELVGEKKFHEFAAPFIEGNLKVGLELLEKLPQGKLKVMDGLDLLHEMIEVDLLFWEAIVQRIPESQLTSPVIDFLYRLNPSAPPKTIEKIRSKKEKIVVTIYVEGKEFSKFRVQLQPLLNYPYFQSVFLSNFSEANRGELRLDLSDEEAIAFEDLLCYIFKKELKEDHLVPLFKLAHYFGISDAFELCYHLLIQHNSSEAWDLLLTYADGRQTQTIAILCEKIKNSPLEGAEVYLAPAKKHGITQAFQALEERLQGSYEWIKQREILKLVFTYACPEAREKAKGILLGEITSKIDNLSYLNLSRGIEPLHGDVKEKYKEHLHEGIFRPLWETFDPELQAACITYYSKHKDRRLALKTQWSLEESLPRAFSSFGS